MLVRMSWKGEQLNGIHHLIQGMYHPWIMLCLTGTVKFHVCDLFHLFDEAEFMSKLYEF